MNAPMKRSRHSFSSASTTSTSWSGGPTSRRDSVSGRWIEDNACASCTKCERLFTLMNRRHHCRICGHIFCNSCSRTRIMFAMMPSDVKKRQRVCDPCASHAQSNAILYDIDDNSERVSHFSTVSSNDFVMDSKTTDITDVPVVGPSVGFMAASMVCFAAAFWFLMDEVAWSNPAIWILLAGFLKNLYQLRISIQYGSRQQSRTEHTKHIEVKTSSHIHANHQEEVAMVNAPPATSSDNPLELTDAQKAEILSMANKSVDTLYEIATSQDNWTPEANSFPIDNVSVFSRDGKPVRIYKCEAEIDLSPEELFDLLHGEFETSSSWNVTAADNKILQRLNEDTDIVHVTSAPALNGVIASRDFINTRTWRKKDGGYIISSVCAGKNLVKPVKSVTRGENGETGFLILPHESSAFKSRMVWILNVDIKGYFPGSLIRKGSISELCCFVRNLRRHLAQTMGSDSVGTST